MRGSDDDYIGKTSYAIVVGSDGVSYCDCFLIVVCVCIGCYFICLLTKVWEL